MEGGMIYQIEVDELDYRTGIYRGNSRLEATCRDVNLVGGRLIDHRRKGDVLAERLHTCIDVVAAIGLVASAGHIQPEGTRVSQHAVMGWSPATAVMFKRNCALLTVALTGMTDRSNLMKL